MSEYPALYATDKNGAPCLKELLGPFFRMILPAFLDGAQEITVRTAISKEAVGISVAYSKAGLVHHLTAPKDFNPSIVFIRIKIMSNMSLELGQRQAGTIRVQFGDRHL